MNQSSTHLIPETAGTWVGFLGLIGALLFIDLVLFHRGKKELAFGSALRGVLFWVLVAIIFNLWVYSKFGKEAALQFLTGYLVEESLSIDNLFVFLVIFNYFAVPKEHYQRVLFLGILGALVMRGIFIFAGLELLQAFHWMTEVLGLLLLLSSIKLLASGEKHYAPDRNPAVRLFQRFVPMHTEYHGEKFFVRHNGVLKATPLLLVLFAVEVTDLLFAIDSVPAIFAITSEPFIIYSSNIFAILGLRSLFFVVSGAILRLRFLNTGLALVLIFVGCKMLTNKYYTLPATTSLIVIVVLISASALASLLPQKSTSKS